MNKFSETLVYLRKRDGLSQQELADKIKMSRSLVGMYESGRRMPSFEILKVIADTFNVNIDFLMGYESEKKEPIPVSEDGLDENDKRLMGLLKDLTPDQKQLLLAQLKAWTEQNR